MEKEHVTDVFKYVYLVSFNSTFDLKKDLCTEFKNREKNCKLISFLMFLVAHRFGRVKF